MFYYVMVRLKINKDNFEKKIRKGFFIMENLECQKNEFQQTEKEKKLDKKVLIAVLAGIAGIFLAMLVINGIIYTLFPEEKTRLYVSIVISNTLFLLLILGIKSLKGIKWEELGWKGVNPARALKEILKVWAVTWVIYIVYLIYLSLMGVTPPENELYELLAKPNLILFLLNVLLIAVVAPFIEETLFRGILFGSLRTYCGKWTAIIISAFIFAALHFDLIGLFPRFILGIGLGYLYVNNDSIFPSIGLHGLNNFLAVLFVSWFS